MKDLALMVATTIALAMLQLQSAMADEIAVPVVGHKWYVTVDMPALDIVQGRKHGESYQFQGVSQNGFNVSFFVEPPAKADGTHEDCYLHYWSKMTRNPMIDLNSVTVEKTDRFVKVSYDYKGLPANVPRHHFNYYIAHSGSWLDFHLSMTTEQKPDFVASKFGESLEFHNFPLGVESVLSSSEKAEP